MREFHFFTSAGSKEKPTSNNCMVMKNYDLRLLPCGYFAMIAHEEEKDG